MCRGQGDDSSETYVLTALLSFAFGKLAHGECAARKNKPCMTDGQRAPHARCETKRPPFPQVRKSGTPFMRLVAHEAFLLHAHSKLHWNRNLHRSEPTSDIPTMPQTGVRARNEVLLLVALLA